GDDFEEMVISGDNLIVRVKGLPVREMDREEDQFGRLKDPAYVQRSLSNHDDVIAQFQDFQIVHFRNDRPRSSKYGRSLLKSARRLWRRLQLMEDGMVVARLARTPMRYIFHVPGGDLDLASQLTLIHNYRH